LRSFTPSGPFVTTILPLRDRELCSLARVIAFGAGDCARLCGARAGIVMTGKDLTAQSGNRGNLGATLARYQEDLRTLSHLSSADFGATNNV
jgi:hypothetical protein